MTDASAGDVPNSVTVLIILQELGRRYQSTPVKFEDLEDEFFKDIELDHRLPGTNVLLLLTL